MKQDYYSLVEMGFTGAVVLGFAFWQLVSINRQIRQDRDAAARKSTESARHSVGEHLPDDR